MLLTRRIMWSWIIVAGILLVLGFVTRTSYLFPRSILLPWLLLSPFTLLGIRLMVYMGLHWARSKGRNSRTVVIAGAGDLGLRLATQVVKTPWLGMQFFGFFDDATTASEIGPEHNRFPVLGSLDDMINFVNDHKIDMVYLALPLRAEARIRDIVAKIKDTTASVYFVPDVFTFSLLQAQITDLQGIPLISLWETPFYGLNGWMKRLEDLVLACLILVLTLPAMLLIALGVKLSSPGPVLFKQRRYGLNGEEILIYKFRTMRVCEDGPDVPQATKNDARVTPFGAFLRKTNLDELPQFLNVLQGRMSIVGPRPHAVAHNEFYRQCIPGYMLRHKVRPGITGWAQVNGWRGETETLNKMEKRIEYDLEYLRQWSFGLDLKIILLTITRSFADKNAY
jgi:putative colanic acid biosynthesis UDP-glucose lipid carrier transferase